MSTQTSLKKSADHLLSQIRDCIETTEAHLSDGYRATKRSVVAGAKTADRTIRRHPYESLGIAFALGVVVGVLISRESDPS